MKLTYKIEEPKTDKTNTRVSVVVEVRFTDNVEKRFAAPESVVLPSTIPVTLYQHAGTYITLATKRTVEHNGESKTVKAFRLRQAPVDSYDKKAHLQLHFPGKMHLGYVEKSELKKLETWLKQLDEEAKPLISAYLQAKELGQAPVQTITVESSHDINGVEVNNLESSRLIRD